MDADKKRCPLLDKIRGYDMTSTYLRDACDSCPNRRADSATVDAVLLALADEVAALRHNGMSKDGNMALNEVVFVILSKTSKAAK